MVEDFTVQKYHFLCEQLSHYIIFQHAAVHGILGLIAIGLGLIQILSGFLRPNPQGKTRPVWRWTHRLFGVAAFIIAGWY